METFGCRVAFIFLDITFSSFCYMSVAIIENKMIKIDNLYNILLYNIPYVHAKA